MLHIGQFFFSYNLLNWNMLLWFFLMFLQGCTRHHFTQPLPKCPVYFLARIHHCLWKKRWECHHHNTRFLIKNRGIQETVGKHHFSKAKDTHHKIPPYIFSSYHRHYLCIHGCSCSCCRAMTSCDLWSWLAHGDPLVLASEKSGQQLIPCTQDTKVKKLNYTKSTWFLSYITSFNRKPCSFC